MKIKVAKPNTRYGSFMLPVNCVYASIPEHSEGGRHYMPCIAWIEDFASARNRRKFPVYILRPGYASPMRKVIDSRAHLWASMMRDFVKREKGLKPVVYPITRKQARAIAPKDRRPQVYNLRGVPSFDTAPHISTEYSVTANCKIGHNFYREEGYCAVRMGMPTPHYN